MLYSEWEPIYERIVAEFGYSREEDERSARVLESLMHGKSICDDDCLRARIGWEVTVCGNAPGLDRGLERFSPRGTLICADGATGRLMNKHIWPDLIVTDLDGEIEPQLRANEKGAVMIVHAHGDNLKAIQEVVPLIKGPMAGTTQSRPFGLVKDYGGFTDGDRGVELARHFGARKVHLLGFDFLNPAPKEGKSDEVKRRKLAWAKDIICERNPPHVVLSIP